MQHDFILLDRSGSMGSLWGEALSAVNGYVKKLADDKVDTGVTLAVFDSGSFDVLRDRIVPSTWNKVLPSEAEPRSFTPLNDSVGKIVAMAKAGINGVQYDRVAIIIMTDGLENASRELTTAQAKALLDECRAKNWQVIFLGANFDNWEQGKSYGSVRGQTAQVAPENLAASMESLAGSRGDYAVSGATMDFADDEREDLKKEKRTR